MGKYTTYTSRLISEHCVDYEKHLKFQNMQSATLTSELELQTEFKFSFKFKRRTLP